MLPKKLSIKSLIKEGAEKLLARVDASLEKTKAKPPGGTESKEFPERKAEVEQSKAVAPEVGVGRSERDPGEEGVVEPGPAGDVPDKDVTEAVEVPAVEKPVVDVEVREESVGKFEPTFEELSRAAYLNYRGRCEQGLPGDEQSDWFAAIRGFSWQ